MNLKKFHKELLAIQEPSFQMTQRDILPNVAEERIIGIRLANLLKFAKKFFDDKSKAEFMKNLPHKYFEEDLLHVKFISEMKNYKKCVEATNKFLPYLDNWAVCDSLIPKIFASHTNELEEEIKIWLASEATYTVRFAIFMQLKFYLDENFDKKYLQQIADITSDEYYIEMMAAWFFTEALIKHYDEAIIFLQKNLLYKKIHTKTIEKALESTRLSNEQKEYLKTLRGRKY